MAAPTHLLYLHGFRSSPLSFKAQRMGRWMAEHRPDIVWHCPQLPPSPAEAVAGLLDTIARWGIDPSADLAVIGSSLGGFYATVLAARLGCRFVVINPAVEPARDLEKYIGEQTTWQDPSEHFHFKAAFIPELQALRPATVSPVQRGLAIIAQGDELLDWREMFARYEGAHIKLLEGSDHALSDFDDHLADILGFLDLTAAPDAA
ncbi:YqiA/YcfP family alpha/beta fold hydrolase [Sphaerotilus microaerophilus]|uniref:Esterase n=1 Tax=Sphaerotilus microaerophilus TaxID=2914710 RepID=A0ABN6PSQ6_9BURK|nr:YqiA/YcfP family alpha/beta fold hydrolase [Sphaerotilus sp. FB-5]BDI08225.1 esterase [Sphaerotilus sp. FB-5]